MSSNSGTRLIHKKGSSSWNKIVTTIKEKVTNLNDDSVKKSHKDCLKKAKDIKLMNYYLWNLLQI